MKGTTILVGLALLGISPLESDVSRVSYEQLRLGFPLSGYRQDTARIRDVFDHAMDGAYYSSNRVVSYTGEKGSVRVDSQGCMTRKGHQPFRVNGHYVGTEQGPAVLCYDAHPGYDFSAPRGTPVKAAASGFVRFPELYHSVPATIHNTLEIEHPGTDCSTWYLHMQERFVSPGEFVPKGRVIGTVGSVGTSADYLHFEVQCDGEPVDPYGWAGEGPDPYRIANRLLWE